MIVKTKKGMGIKDGPETASRGKPRALGESFYTPGGTSQRGIPPELVRQQNRTVRVPKKDDTIVDPPKKVSRFHHLFKKGTPKDG